MTPSDDPISEYLTQAARMLNLPIRPEHYDEVLVAFRALRIQAELLTEFALPEGIEAARFVP